MPRVQVSNLHNLRRPKVRQSWNKLNLYILSGLRAPHLKTKSFFQQKWLAKSMTRTYHGEHVREKQWERLFSPSIHSARHMDPTRLALSDGSAVSAGRGSGLDSGFGQSAFAPVGKMMKTPYMQMVYHQLERRLDTAIFRALFASSVQQARQMVLHGQVKVNGRVFRHPGYALNPGDMFSVNPEKVMIATGAPKTFVSQEMIESDKAPASESAETADSAATEAPAETSIRPVNPELLRDSLTTIRSDIKSILDGDKLRSKQKRAFRSLLKDTLRAMSRPASDSVEALTQHFSLLKTAVTSSSSSPTSTDSTSSEETPTKPRSNYSLKKNQLSNPFDPSKPYLTPWRPRDYMSAFAFIPRYLEVNQKVCSAVYLRHPVCRPGVAEVPSPFPIDISGLVFNWYLRRR